MKPADYLASTLRERIHSAAPGEKLPSVRALMKKYNTSLYSTNAALRQLESEGLIETRKGSGIYISPLRGMRYIDLHRPLYPSVRLDSKELSLERAVKKAGWKLRVLRHSILSEDVELDPNPKTSAHVVMLPNTSAFLRQNLGQEYPILVYGRPAETPDIDYVTGNDLQCLSLLVKHLAGIGHRRIAFLDNEPASRHLVARSQLLINVCSILELPPPLVIDCGTRSGQSSMLMAYERMKTFLQECKGRLDFTAIITSSPPANISVLRSLHEVGLRVPRDCSLASFSLDLANALHTPSITEAGIVDEAWGRTAVEALTQRFDNPQAPRIGLEITPTISIRESTAPPRQA